MRELGGRIAVVTGAGSGIGRAIALALAARGASVWCVGRSLAALEDVKTRAGAGGGEVVCAATDLTRDEQVQALSTRLEREAGGVDVLVHSAGVVALGLAGSAPVAELDRQYQVNLRAPYLLTQLLLPLLRSRRGQVVFINSSAGLAAPPNASQYAATKFGLRALADSLRAEVNPDGVRVLTVFPGRTATAMGQAVHAMEGKPYHPEVLAQPEDIAHSVIAALTLAETAEVTELTVRPTRKP